VTPPPEPPPTPPPLPDEDDPAPKALMTAGFWVALAFGLACVLAGLAVAALGHRGAL
jgi:hypothetical protein